MKNKFFLIFLFLGAVLVISVFFINYKKKYKGTNFKFISTDKFYEKLNKPPDWAILQIQEDFQNFSEISSKNIESTYNKIQSEKSEYKNAFFRYRIHNNKLYKYDKVDKKIDLEKAILTLLKIKNLPDMEFIYCDLDGLPQIDGDEAKNVYEEFYSVEESRQAPIFVQSKISGYKNLILIPDHNSLSKNWKHLFDKILESNKSIIWGKKESKAFWRGGTNDKEYFLENYKTRPRYIISKLSKENFEIVDAGFTTSWFVKIEDILRDEDLFKLEASETKHLEYKYLPVIDGHMCTYPGYQWRLLSSSLCLKQESKEIQWFYKGLLPYKHFIPIKNDLSDFLDKIGYLKINDDLGILIAANATEFAKENLSFEAVYAYLYDVLIYYSKLFKINDFDQNKWQKVE